MTGDSGIQPCDWAEMMQTLHSAAASSASALKVATEARDEVRHIRRVVIGDGTSVSMVTRQDLAESAIADLQAQRKGVIAWAAGVGGVVAGGLIVWALTGTPAQGNDTESHQPRGGAAIGQQ